MDRQVVRRLSDLPQLHMLQKILVCDKALGHDRYYDAIVKYVHKRFYVVDVFCENSRKSYPIAINKLSMLTGDVQVKI